MIPDTQAALQMFKAIAIHITYALLMIAIVWLLVISVSWMIYWTEVYCWPPFKPIVYTVHYT